MAFHEPFGIKRFMPSEVGGWGKSADAPLRAFYRSSLGTIRERSDKFCLRRTKKKAQAFQERRLAQDAFAISSLWSEVPLTLTKPQN